MRTAALLLCLIVAQEAAAQSVFVEGAFSREVKRFSHEGDRSAFDGTASGFSIGVAGLIATRWSVGVEFDRGGRSTVTETVSVTISGRPREIHTSYTSRRRSVSAVAGFHTPSDRLVQVGCYVGLSFTAFRREISSDAPAIVLEQPAPLAVYEERITGALVGIDAAIRISRHFAVVPALRAQGLSLSGDLTGFSLRPSIGGRVTF